MVDAFRARHPVRKDWTWFGSQKRNKGSLIDRVFVSNSLIQMVDECDVYDLGIAAVDHKATYIDIHEDTERRAPARFFGRKVWLI